MKHHVRVIFGKEQVIKFNNDESLTKDEKNVFEKEFGFDTLEEKSAFIQGLNEAIGWVDFCIPELELQQC